MTIYRYHGQNERRAAQAAIVRYDSCAADPAIDDVAHTCCQKVYDLPPEVLTALTLKTGVEEKEEQAPSSKQSGTDIENGDNLVGSQACSLCGLGFASVLDQRSHQKSDWHHYNLKQKIRGDKPVSEVDFEKLIGGMC